MPDPELPKAPTKAQNGHLAIAKLPNTLDPSTAPTSTEQNGNSLTPPPDITVKPAPNLIKRLVIVGAIGIVAIAAGIYGYRWWQFASTHQETDDAYISADVHPINARIAGTVVQVVVNDNQVVKQGQLLVKLDPRDYSVNLDQTKAALEVARYQAQVAQANIGVASTNAQGLTTQAQGNIDAAIASVSKAQVVVIEAQAGISVAQAQLAQVEAALVKAKLDYDRYSQLVEAGAVPRSQFDAAKATYDATLAQRQAIQKQGLQANARLAQAQQNLNNTEAKLAATKGTLTQANANTQQTNVSRQQYKASLAAIAQAQAQVKNAQLQLSYVNITAPTYGQVGNKTVQIGQRVQPAQTLMSVVSSQPWVIANFKETQLEKMQQGQVVEIKIDALPSHIFKGRLDSIAPASGAKFALLPPDNATGNFTKIVQRVPVKVVLDLESIRGFESRLTPGLSVKVTVDTL